MRRSGATRVLLSPLICGSLSVWLALSGCNNTCVLFTSNPPTGKLEIVVTDAKPTCTLTTVKGTVLVEIGSSPMPSPSQDSSSAQHIFVTLRGIEAHPSMAAGDDSPDWQQLAPQLARHPLQVDLMERVSPCAASPSVESDVPAGVYRQIRVRLVPNQPAQGEQVPDVNACGRVGFNCVVRADGSTHPLVLDGAAPEVRIASEQVDGGSLFILPDTVNAVSIKFNANLLPAFPASDAVRLVSALTTARRTTCESIQGLQH